MGDRKLENMWSALRTYGDKFDFGGGGCNSLRNHSHVGVFVAAVTGNKQLWMGVHMRYKA